MTQPDPQGARAAGLSVESFDIPTMLGLALHATEFELRGAIARDAEADHYQIDAYDRRILLVTLQSALAALSEATQ